LIDDIQFISNKDKTQEEIFHIFNTLYENNKQIVFTSDRPPKSIQGIEERLRSRFEGGMIVDISLPDYETRLAILMNKLREKNYSLPDDIIEYIALNIKSNIRELEGSLNTILIKYQLKNQTPGLEDVKKILEDHIKKPVKMVSSGLVIKTVSGFYNIPEPELKGDSRRQDIIKARQVAMYILRDVIKCSYPVIGSYFDNKDHTTVMHSCEKISKSIKVNANLAQEIYTLTDKIVNSPF
jgi:chromosomal replication initiator protein